VLAEQVEILPLLQKRLLAPTEIEFGDVAAGVEAGAAGDHALRQPDTVALRRRLRLKVGNFRGQPVHEGGEPVALGGRALALQLELAGQQVALAREGIEDGSTDLGALGGDLGCRHGDQRLACLDGLAFCDMNLADRPGLREVDAGGSGAGHQEAGDRFLARVRRDEEKGNQQGDGGDEAPGGDAGGQRLHEGNAAPLALIALKVDGLLPEQGAMMGHRWSRSMAAVLQPFSDSAYRKVAFPKLGRRPPDAVSRNRQSCCRMRPARACCSIPSCTPRTLAFTFAATGTARKTFVSSTFTFTSPCCGWPPVTASSSASVSSRMVFSSIVIPPPCKLVRPAWTAGLECNRDRANKFSNIDCLSLAALGPRLRPNAQRVPVAP
jgi:hypothetical protein